MKTLTAALLASVASMSLADDRQVVNADQAQAETSVCLAYYSIILDCSAQDLPARASAQAAVDALTLASERLSQGARLAPADVTLRLHLNLLDQTSFFGGDCSASGVLRSRYEAQCSRLRR